MSEPQMPVLRTRTSTSSGPTDATYVHQLTESMKHAFADRASYLADGAYADLPIERLLSDAYLDERAAAIGKSAARPEKYGTRPAPPDDGGTTHVSVVDSHGSIASVTTSAGENAGYVVGDTGVCMNNILGEIDLHPQGFHRLPPMTRLTTMMSPAVVLRQGEPLLAVGSGGSNRLRSAITQVISNVVDFGMPLADAIDAPRVHFEGGLLQAEGGIPDTVVRDLEGAGYQVNHWPGPNMFFGGAHAVARQNGQLGAAGDRRRGGSVAEV